MTSIIDRVMAAYTSRFVLSPEMDTRVRAELAPFIASLLSGEGHGADHLSLFETAPVALTGDVLEPFV